jgi:hypothetical protein
MPLETFEDLDAVPEDARETAIETKDGKFVVFRDADTSGLTSALAKEREARKTAEKAAKAAAEAAREKDLAAAGLLDAKKRWDEEYLTPIQTRAQQLEAEVRQLKLVTPVKDALRAAGVIDPDDAYKLLADRFDLTDEGQPILRDNPTADIRKWAETDLAKAKPYLFAGSMASGGGAKGAAPGGKPARVISASDTKAFLANVDAIAAGDVVVVD